MHQSVLLINDSHHPCVPIQSNRPYRELICESVRQIGDVLQVNAQLEYLALSKCHIPYIGARALASVLRNHGGLQGLDISHNPFATDISAQPLDVDISHKPLASIPDGMQLISSLKVGNAWGIG